LSGYQCSPRVAKSGFASISGRSLRGAMRAIRPTARAAHRRGEVRSPASLPRAFARRAAWRTLRAAEVRIVMREGIRYREGNTAADRIAVCSLEKSYFPGGRNR